MPFADLDGIRLHYVTNGPATGQALLLSNSLGTSLEMWAPQVPVWSQTRTVIRYDTRGHGQSTALMSSWSIAELADDVIHLLDELGQTSVDFCGLSMGGMIGMTLAARYPERIRKLVLANTSPKIGTDEIWNSRIRAVSERGMGEVASQVRSRWFTPSFIEAHEQPVAHSERMMLETDPAGYAQCCASIRDTDLWAEAHKISSPTLIIAGDADPVIPNFDQERLRSSISGSKLLRLTAAHLSNIECATEFTNAVLSFISE